MKEDNQRTNNNQDQSFLNNEEMGCKIEVIGVGGAGIRAITKLKNGKELNATFIPVDTDNQQLDPNRLFSEETMIAFIVASMSDATARAKASEISRIAKESGILAIGITALPNLSEGTEKNMDAVKEFQEMADSIFVVNSECLDRLSPEDTEAKASEKSDDAIAMILKNILEMGNSKGYINLDYNDIANTLQAGGVSVVTTGYGEGEDRVKKAIEAAVQSPIVGDMDIRTGKRMLFNLYFSREAEEPFLIDETNHITEFLSSVDRDVDVIWGVAYDDTLGNKVKFTILASGIEPA